MRRKKLITAVKKTHKVKNNVVVADNGRILYLSKTYEGSVHDKAIIDEENWQFPKGIIVYEDSGFEGHNPVGVQIERPVKKPKGGELTTEQKQANHKKASKRVKVEHSIGRIKIFRILKDRIRIWKNEAKDLAMEIGCAIANFKIAYKT
jgi:hypothetical protein